MFFPLILIYCKEKNKYVFCASRMVAFDLSYFTDFEQVKNFSSDFADLEHIKIFSSHFTDFEQ